MNPSEDAIPASAAPRPSDVTDDLVDGLKRFLICNPFYLASAALLLFGLSRLTQDTQFLNTETRQVLFQFVVLQGYGFLLVGTALWLSRQQIWYDSALLVVLENGLLLAPFLGISQAVLLDEPLAWSLALSGGFAVLGRGWSIRRWYPGFNLPDRARLIGALVLAINVGLPLAYRTRVDTDWHTGNRILWLAILPVLALLPNLLVRSRKEGGTAAQSPWLPLLIQGLWIAGTAVHAWSIAWVDKTPTPNVLLMPVIIASLWTLQWRHLDFGAGDHVWFRATLLVASTLGGFWPSDLREVSMAIAVLNAALFVAHAHLGTRGSSILRIIAWTAAAVSALRFAQLLRPEWFEAVKDPKSCAIVGGWILGGGFTFLMLRSRNPVAGVLGGIVAAIGAGLLPVSGQPHVAIQVGVLFSLFHSLRWPDQSSSETWIGRAFLVVVWTSDSLAWSWDLSQLIEWTPCAVGILTSVAFVVLRRRFGMEVSMLLLGSGGLNALIAPGIWVSRNVPGTLLMLGLSLACFAAGTVLALRRHQPKPSP